MKKATMVLAGSLILATASAFAAAQAGPAAEAERAAVIAAALDYSDGAYSGDAVRMERAIHPDLNKLIFTRRSPAMGLASRYSPYSELIEIVRAGLVSALPPEKRRTETSVLEITEDVACVKVKTAMWCDFLQLIKVNGRWKIINVLWTLGLNTPPQQAVVPGFDAERERPAAQAAALDYMEGRLAGDAARLERVLHPETSQGVLMVSGKTKMGFVRQTRYSGILEPVKAGLGLAPENARRAEVRILDMMDGMAFAAAKTAMEEAYLQLQLMDGRWRAINILVRPTNNIISPPPPDKK